MTTHDPHENTLLGQNTDYPTAYAPEILCAIERQQGRAILEQSLALTPSTQIPIYYGYDVWQAYEVSWLNPRGKPCVACAEIRVPATSPCIVESKSFKLYLNSLNQHVFKDEQALIDTVSADISNIVKAQVRITLYDVETAVSNKVQLSGTLLDNLDIAVDTYQVSPELLQLADPRAAVQQQNDQNAQPVVTETLYSHLLRSSCPVTAQPDWGSVVIRYTGAAIDHVALLKYIISFRNNQEFHEQCIERMYSDIMLRCQPQELTVSGYYLRRGGLDINPVRSSINIEEPAVQTTKTPLLVAIGRQ